jgi:hypothetical protein
MLYRIDAWVCTSETKEHQACSQKDLAEGKWRGLVVEALHMRMMVAWKLSQGFGIGVWLRVGLHVALLALGRERYGQGETRPAIDAWWGLMKGANTRRLLQTYLGRYFARV